VQQLFQWQSSKYRISWVFVSRLSYPAQNAHAPYCHLLPSRLYSVFPLYITNGKIFENIEYKMCVLIYCTFVWNFFILNRIDWYMFITVYWSSCKVTIIQCDSKRWTQLKSKRRLNTRQTVGCGIPSSLFALRVDLRGLRSKLSWIRLTFSSDTCGRPELLPLQRQPICSNWWFQRQILFLVAGWMLKRRRNVRWTAVAGSVLMNSRT